MCVCMSVAREKLLNRRPPDRRRHRRRSEQKKKIDTIASQFRPLSLSLSLSHCWPFFSASYSFLCHMVAVEPQSHDVGGDDTKHEN